MPIPTPEETYHVECEGGGCEHCGHAHLWTVVGPDYVGLGRSWEDRELADDVAEYMNMAHVAALQQAQATIRRLEQEITELREGLIDALAMGDGVTRDAQIIETARQMFAEIGEVPPHAVGLADLEVEDSRLLSRIFNAHSGLYGVDQTSRINEFLKRTIEVAGNVVDQQRCVCPDCGHGFCFDFQTRRVTCKCEERNRDK